jgi:oligo-1,6-glucosidase
LKQTNWFKDAIIYQIYPRSFCDSNGDGMGDIKGITSKLDHLVKLGVNCVWLSPVYESPMDDNGYDIADYRAISPLFGCMDDFDEMITEMHKRGIHLIMDLVMNHTSDEHPWFLSAKQDVNSPFHNYYIWKKGIKGKEPNNWTGFFGEKAWSYNEATDEWYLHLFSKKQPDVNWENPMVRKEFEDIIKFWCDKGVDGFRMDVINLISKDQQFKNGKELIFLKGSKSYINGPRLHEYLQQINQNALSHYDTLTVGETVFTKIDDVHKMTDENRHELSMVFNFDHTSVDNFFGVKWFMRKFSLVRFKKILSFYQNNLQEKGWNSLFYENHDQRRSVGRFNTSDTTYRVPSAKMLATSMYFLKGTPFIYEGQEIGMTNTDIDKLEDYQDIETHNIYKTAKAMHFPKKYLKKTIKNGTRDNARTPMQWDNSEYAGFSKVKPWLKVNANKDTINVAQSYEDENSIFAYYQKLIQVRKQESLVKEGKYHLLYPNHSKLFAYERIGVSEKLLVLANYSDKELKLPKMDLENGTILLNNYQDFTKSSLHPYQALVLKIKQ